MGRGRAMVSAGDVFVCIMAMGRRSLVLLMGLFIYLFISEGHTALCSQPTDRMRPRPGMGGVSIYVQCAIHFSRCIACIVSSCIRSSACTSRRSCTLARTDAALSLLSLAACGGCSGGYPDGSHRTISGGYSAGPSQSERVSSPPVSQKDDHVNLHHLDVRV